MNILFCFHDLNLLPKTMKLFSLLSTIFLFIGCQFSFAQDQHLIDSLQNSLNKTGEDSSKADILYALSRAYSTNNPAQSMTFANQCLSLSEKIGYTRGIGNANNANGYGNMQTGNYNKAIEQLKIALNIRLQLGDKPGSIKTYRNIIASYKKLNNAEETLKYYLAVIKLLEETGDLQGIIDGYNEIGNIYTIRGDYEEGLTYFFSSLKINEEIGDKFGIANSYLNIGLNYENQKNYLEALKNHSTALKIREEINDKNGMAYAYYNIGYIKEQQGNYIEGLKNYFSALKIMEEINNREGIADSYIGIGNIYQAQRNFSEALKNFLSALKIREELGDPFKIAEAYNAVGIVYDAQKNFPEALRHYTTSLNINQEIGYKNGIASAYNNIGELYKNENNYTEALKNLTQSLKLHEERGDKNGMAACYINIGYISTQEKKYNEASQYLNKALSFSKETGNMPYIKQTYDYMTTLDSIQGNFDQALVHFRLSVIYQDSIINIQNAKQIVQQQMQYDFDKKDAIAKQTFQRQQDSLKYENAKRELFLQKEMQLKSITYEYEKKQAAAKSEKERQQLRYEEALKRKQVEYEYKQKQLAIETEFRAKQAAQKAKQEKKDALTRQEIERQKIVRNALMGGLALVLVFAGIFFTQRNKIQKGKKRSDELLLNILPEEVAEELKEKGSAAAKHFDEVTVLFTDFKGFTQLSELLTPTELVAEINHCFSAFDHIMQKHQVEKIKTIGDAYMAVGGIPTPNKTHAMDVVNAALDIQQFMLDHKEKMEAAGKLYFEIRIGIHTGPVVAGIVGVKKFAYDIWGDTVNTASRMESSGEVGSVNISESTYALVRDQFTCTHRGKIQAKGKGEIDMYFVSR
ncbi:MAG: tetratricopeptide repeat protein [Chitinophagaceae bacterium]|nr:tetratricopeptide repeat protein [Chitinophagaceae bacterium]